jgi:hypothetical protein
MARDTRARQPEDRPTQFRDFDAQGQEAMHAAMGEHGKVASRLSHTIEVDKAAAANEANKPVVRNKARIRAGKLESFAGDIEDKPISLESAAAARVSEFDRGLNRAQAEGSVMPRGSGWYFEHRRDLEGMASEHGFDIDTVIKASASMSPLNSPDNEKAAVGEMMRAVSGKHTVVPKTHAAAKLIGGERGVAKGIHELTGDQLRDVSLTKNQAAFHTPEGTDLKRIARGAVNIDKGFDVLTGRRAADQVSAQDPKTAAKVWSYENAIRNAVPGSPEHHEYMTRIDMASRGGGHDALDLWGMREATHGILDPHGHTAEDTWMNTITMNQGMGDEPVREPGGRGVLGKTVASHKELGLAPRVTGAMPGISRESALHAYNNQATQDAAAAVSTRAGGHFQLPAVAMQETAWTEARIRTGKDPSFNAEQKLNQAQFSKAKAPKQGTLF